LITDIENFTHFQTIKATWNSNVASIPRNNPCLWLF